MQFLLILFNFHLLHIIQLIKVNLSIFTFFAVFWLLDGIVWPKKFTPERTVTQTAAIVIGKYRRSFLKLFLKLLCLDLSHLSMTDQIHNLEHIPPHKRQIIKLINIQHHFFIAVHNLLGYRIHIRYTLDCILQNIWFTHLRVLFLFHLPLRLFTCNPIRRVNRTRPKYVYPQGLSLDLMQLMCEIINLFDLALDWLYFLG